MKEPPLGPEFAAALYRALHVTSGARERWAALATTGPTDEAILDQLRREWGGEGGFGSPGGPFWMYRGGPHPRLDMKLARGSDTVRFRLEGGALIDEVRRALRIDGRAPSAQLDLFA